MILMGLVYAAEGGATGRDPMETLQAAASALFKQLIKTDPGQQSDDAQVQPHSPSLPSLSIYTMRCPTRKHAIVIVHGYSVLLAQTGFSSGVSIVCKDAGPVVERSMVGAGSGAG